MNLNLAAPAKETARRRLALIEKTLREQILAINELAVVIGTTPNQARNYVAALMGEDGAAKQLYIAEWAAKGKSHLRLVPCYGWRTAFQADLPKPPTARALRLLVDIERAEAPTPAPPTKSVQSFASDPLLGAFYGRAA